MFDTVHESYIELQKGYLNKYDKFSDANGSKMKIKCKPKRLKFRTHIYEDEDKMKMKRKMKNQLIYHPSNHS